MQNIQNLLQMPYGCGEQNMLLFAPNIYVLNYLNETQQLTPEIKSKALGYLTSDKRPYNVCGFWMHQPAPMGGLPFHNTA